jgi:hypothetical protein
MTQFSIKSNMKKILIYSVLALLFCALSSNKPATSKKEIINTISQINNRMLATKFDISLKYLLYESVDSEIPHTIENARFQRNDDHEAYKMGNTYIYSDSDKKITVSKDENIIVISNPAKESSFVFDNKQVKQILKHCSQAIFIKNNNTNGIRLKIKESFLTEFDAMEIYYHDDYTIESIKLFYRNVNYLGKEWVDKQPFMDIKYSYSSKIDKLNYQLFEVSNYASKLPNNLYKGKNEYSGFQIIDLRN